MKIHPAVSMIISAALGLQALFLSGCASGYTRPVGQAATPFRASAQNPVAKVSVQVTPEVSEKLKNSFKFDQQQLVSKVELALSNRQLFNKEGKENTVAMEILVTHVRVRNTFNAVMWGAMSGNDSIKGDVLLRDAAGTIVDRFHVDTSYALGGWAGGQDSMRMNWLYEAFAKQVVTALSGETKKG